MYSVHTWTDMRYAGIAYTSLLLVPNDELTVLYAAEVYTNYAFLYGRLGSVTLYPNQN